MDGRAGENVADEFVLNGADVVIHAEKERFADPGTGRKTSGTRQGRKLDNGIADVVNEQGRAGQSPGVRPRDE